MKKFLLAAATAASALIVAAPASAAVTFDYAPAVTPTGFTVVQDFNTNTTGLSGSGYQICAAPIANICSAPNSSNSPFLAVRGGGTATYTLTNAAQQVSFDWGTASIDNVLTVTTADGATQQYTVAGSDIPNGPNYNRNALLVSSTNGSLITKLSFAAGSNSFEVDNIAVKGAVPEPATWGMMLLGFGVAGAAMRRRRTSVSFA